MTARIQPLTPAQLLAQCARIDRLIDVAQAHQLELTKLAAQRRAFNEGNRLVFQALGSRTPTRSQPGVAVRTGRRTS